MAIIGKLSIAGELAGAAAGAGAVSGRVAGPATQAGVLSGDGALTAGLTGEGEAQGRLTLPPTHEAFTGPYTVSPQYSDVTLATNGMLMTDDVTVEAIPEELIDTTDATLADGSGMLYPYTSYANGVKHTGSIQSLAAATYTPGTANQIISGGKYLEGDQTILGDENLKPSNILSGASIFGVAGSVVAGYLPASAELVASTDAIINLSSHTSYDSWTPSTANTSILTSGTARAACSYQFNSSNYKEKAVIAACMFHTVMAYPQGTTFAKGYMLTKTIYSLAEYAPMKMPNYSIDNYGTPFFGSLGRGSYYSSATNISLLSSTSYGVGPSAASFSLNSGTSASRVIGWTRPVIYARCNSNYFSTAAAAALDSANTNIYCYYRIWLIDKEDSRLYRFFDAANGSFFT